MNIWIVALFIGVLMVGAIFLFAAPSVNAESPTKVSCSSCGGGCTADKNCGSASCGAVTGTGSCGCGR